MPDGYPQGSLAIAVYSYLERDVCFFDFLQKCGCGNVAVFSQKSFFRIYIFIYIFQILFYNTTRPHFHKYIRDIRKMHGYAIFQCRASNNLWAIRLPHRPHMEFI